MDDWWIPAVQIVQRCADLPNLHVRKPLVELVRYLEEESETHE